MENFADNGLWNWSLATRTTAAIRILLICWNKLFAGNPGRPMVEPCLTEAPWTMAELKKAITRLKTNKAADDVGLVAELLHHSPEVMLEALLHLFRTVLFTGEVPETWKQTVFNMLPKTRGAKSTSDFRPIAVVRLLYKTFAYLVLGRIEATLDRGTTRRTAWIPSRSTHRRTPAYNKPRA